MTSKIYTPKEMADSILASIQGTATTGELERLEKWLEECEANRLFYEQIKDERYRMEKLREFACYDSRQDWQKVRTKIPRNRKALLYRLWPYAALFILLLSVGYIYTLRQSSVVPLAALNDTVRPGFARARLILPDGSDIDLQRGQGEIALRQGNFINQGAVLSYRDTSEKAPAQRHILQIPRGGEYHLVLADGTHIWLNAATEIRYPDHFTGTSRCVELTGEAYFEVAKDTIRPFYVKTAGMLIKVTGTSFNVRAYREEDVQATLVNGRVNVECGNREFQVKPGEQVTLTASGAVLSKVENIRNYIGWKENRFVFEDKPLEEVWKDLERWYDIRVCVVDEKVNGRCFTGNLPKYENIEKVLDIIELATCVECHLQGRTLTVKMEHK